MKPNPAIGPRVPPIRNILVLVLPIVFGGGIAHAQTAAAPGDTESVRQDIETVLSGRDYQRQFPVTPAPPAPETRPAPIQPEAPDFQFETDFEGSTRPLPDMFRYIAWTLIAAGIVYLVYLAMRKMRRDRKRPAETEPVPARTAVQSGTPHSPLDEVERLARDGALADAVHLLLLRFIEDIRTQQGTAVQPALTSREVVASVSLPQTARASLAFIVASVERTRFGGMEIDRDTFEQCLEGYRNFTRRQATVR
ncbi:MAG: DUF4129 domain-containing protein [Alphaproteobacteria bacterium]